MASISDEQTLIREFAARSFEYQRAVLHIPASPRTWNTEQLIISNSTALETLGGSNKLRKLPPELLNMVILVSSFWSASTMRLLDQRTKALVESCLEYKHLVTYAASTMAALVHIGVADHYTVCHLFDVLCSSECSVCGNFAGFLWIPECKRICVPCVQEEPGYMPMKVTNASIAFGLSKKLLETLPVMKTLPGAYGLSLATHRQQVRVLSARWARELALDVHGGESGLAAYLQRASTKPAMIAYQLRIARKGGVDSRGHMKNNFEDLSRYMVTTAMPVLLRDSGEVVTEGLFCKGCRAVSGGTSDAASDEASDHTVRFGIRTSHTKEGPVPIICPIRHFKGCLTSQRIRKEKSYTTCRFR